MSECNSFAELREVASSVADILELYPMPPNYSKEGYWCEGFRGQMDKIALEVVPSFLKSMYPVLTVVDGNCVPRALSLASFGDQDHHVEVRCRIVVELVCNRLDYLCLPPSDLHFLQIMSDSYCEHLNDIFDQECLSVSKNGLFMGMWQMMAVANVLECKIFSAYPEKASEVYRKFFTRVLYPRQLSSEHVIVVLWSATEAHDKEMPKHSWTANHVVPLMGCATYGVVTIR